MTRTTYLIDMADSLDTLARVQSRWSQETFGPDSLRGPMGPLKHLEKEAREAQASPTDIKEYADILILLLDASRRAGHSPLQVIEAALDKMDENRARRWPAFDPSKADEVVEHVRDGELSRPSPAHVHTRDCFDDPGPGHGPAALICGHGDGLADVDEALARLYPGASVDGGRRAGPASEGDVPPLNVDATAALYKACRLLRKAMAGIGQPGWDAGPMHRAHEAAIDAMELAAGEEPDGDDPVPAATKGGGEC